MIDYSAIPVVQGFIAIASLALAAIGTGVSTFGGLQQGRAQKKLEEARAQASRVDAARERTRQVRAGRTARAQVAQAGADQGVSESSSVRAGAAGAMTQAYQGIQGINQQESAGQAQSAARQGIYDAQGVQTLGQGIGELGGTIFNNRDEATDIFGIKNNG